MVRALRIFHIDSSTGLDGQEFRTLEEATGMARWGHQVTLIVQPGSQLEREGLKKKNLVVERLSMSHSRWISLIFDFLRLIAKCQSHILNIHGSIDSWMASLAGRISKEPAAIIRTRHKSTPIPNSLRHRIFYRKLPHAIVTTGEAIRKAMIADHGIHQ